jgi:hypothetical protein
MRRCCSQRPSELRRKRLSVVLGHVAEAAAGLGVDRPAAPAHLAPVRLQHPEDDAHGGRRGRPGRRSGGSGPAVPACRPTRSRPNGRFRLHDSSGAGRCRPAGGRGWRPPRVVPGRPGDGSVASWPPRPPQLQQLFPVGIEPVLPRHPAYGSAQVELRPGHGRRRARMPGDRQDTTIVRQAPIPAEAAPHDLLHDLRGTRCPVSSRRRSPARPAAPADRQRMAPDGPARAPCTCTPAMRCCAACAVN